MGKLGHLKAQGIYRETKKPLDLSYLGLTLKEIAISHPTAILVPTGCIPLRAPFLANKLVPGDITRQIIKSIGSYAPTVLVELFFWQKFLYGWAPNHANQVLMLAKSSLFAFSSKMILMFCRPGPGDTKTNLPRKQPEK